MPIVNPLLQSIELLFVKDVKDGVTTYVTRRLRNLKVSATPEDLITLSDEIVKLSEGTFHQTQFTVTSSVAAGV